MAGFSNRDIEEAKRRVREMQSRAESYVPHEKETKTNQNSVHSEKKNISSPMPVTEEKPKEDKSDEKDEKDSSYFIILILLMLLSHEGADNKLLLALLYLLL